MENAVPVWSHLLILKGQQCIELPKKVEVKSKLVFKVSHGDFRRFLYEALSKSMT